MNYSNFNPESYILCCDWGTSSFRLQLVEVTSGKVVFASNAEAGVAKTFNRWKETEGVERLQFYQEYLKEHIDHISINIKASLAKTPLVISGMASSSIGIVELPYSLLPFNLNGGKAAVHSIEESETFPHSILLISGVKSDIDVMRGEETQFIGLQEAITTIGCEKNALLILPGTHSKHIRLVDGQMVDFNTYITGELFSVLVKHSLLKEAVETPTSSLSVDDLAEFAHGVTKSSSWSLLQNLFSVRTGGLFKHRNKRQSYFYLSGLLIGDELNTISKGDWDKLVLCSGNSLFELYKKAIEVLGLSSVTHFVLPEEMTKATISGQIKIYKSNQYVNS